MTGDLRRAIEPDLAIEPFVGYRLWRLIPYRGDPILASVTSADPWLGPEMAATCHTGTLLIPQERRPASRRHPGIGSPAVSCTCGVYASKDPRLPPHRRVWASGRVFLWGTVIEGTAGYRAERARVAGDLQILPGMGPGMARCTTPSCRRRADGIWMGSRSLLARCFEHGRGRLSPFDAFEMWVNAAFRRRYGVGARLVDPLASAGPGLD